MHKISFVAFDHISKLADNYPDSEGTDTQRTGTPAGVWAILDEWTKDGGLSSTKLQHYTKPCWLQGDVHQADQLFEELYLEAEIRLMAAYACMTHRKCGAGSCSQLV